MTYLYNLLNGVLDVVYPRICLACKRRRADKHNSNILCGHCAGAIEFSLPPFCHCCGRHLEPRDLHKDLCAPCRRAGPAFDRAYSACAYQGVIRELIHEFKYNGKDYLGKYLSSFMTGFIDAYGVPVSDMDYIIPVPLHASRLREREFNQAHLLARAIADRFDKPVVADTLRRRRPTRMQATLDTGARRENMRGSFTAAQGCSLNGRRVLLIDDVLTSGATASDAARALKAAGAELVFVMTLAH